MQEEARVALMPIWKDVVDPRSVETTRPSLNAVHYVPFVEQKFGEVGAVLARNAGDQSCFSHL